MLVVNNISIENQYYMLAYACGGMKILGNEKVDKEKFEHIHDLFAFMLSKGFDRLIKRGIYKEYSEYSEALPVLRGRLDINYTMLEEIACRRKLFCCFDELSGDNLPNRIIKSVMRLLVAHGTVKKEYKNLLKKQLLYFSEISDINLGQVDWSMVHLHRNNRHYEFLINVCRWLAEGMLFKNNEKAKKTADCFDHKQWCRLYEEFLLEYFTYINNKYHKFEVRKTDISWSVESSDKDREFLPKMQTDIVLSREGHTLIIDAKFYKEILVKNQYDGSSGKLRSGHLYQVFSYVKNEESKSHKQVDGMLLYAQTDEGKFDLSYQWGSNKLYAKTLNLNRPFADIEEDLKKIAGMV